MAKKTTTSKTTGTKTMTKAEQTILELQADNEDLIHDIEAGEQKVLEQHDEINRLQALVNQQNVTVASFRIVASELMKR